MFLDLSLLHLPPPSTCLAPQWGILTAWSVFFHDIQANTKDAYSYMGKGNAEFIKIKNVYIIFEVLKHKV